MQIAIDIGGMSTKIAVLDQGTKLLEKTSFEYEVNTVPF